MLHPAFAIHAGAGTHHTPRQQILDALTDAMRAGRKAMIRSGPVDGVEAAIRVLEWCGLFDAGRGSVRDAAGAVTMDAAIMNGSDQRAGALAGSRHLKHPIHGARLVMDRSGHVFLVGPDADAFALSAGAEIIGKDHFVDSSSGHPGTVGAVARAADGSYAAGTSTGGLSGKRPGRVGDSPVIGAGTWADQQCAISATGIGEIFIRSAFAHSIACRLDVMDASAAADRAIERVVAMGGEGGAVVIAQSGYAFPLRATMMPRGWLTSDGQIALAILPDEAPVLVD